MISLVLASHTCKKRLLVLLQILDIRESPFPVHCFSPFLSCLFYTRNPNPLFLPFSFTISPFFFYLPWPITREILHRWWQGTVPVPIDSFPVRSLISRQKGTNASPCDNKMGSHLCACSLQGIRYHFTPTTWACQNECPKWTRYNITIKLPLRPENTKIYPWNITHRPTSDWASSYSADEVVKLHARSNKVRVYLLWREKVLISLCM